MRGTSTGIKYLNKVFVFVRGMECLDALHPQIFRLAKSLSVAGYRTI